VRTTAHGRAGSGRSLKTTPLEYDVEAIRKRFPTLEQSVHGHPLVYLDSAASTQKPVSVLEAMDRFYRQDNANVHRGVHELSQRATAGYEEARAKVASFLGATTPREITFVRGATEGINLVARSFLAPRLRPGDEVVVTTMEHHSNIVPWQLVCAEKGARVRAAPITDRGELDLEALESMITERTRLLGVVHLSNVLGTINPVRSIIETAHRKGVPVLVDAAQAASHLPLSVRDLDCDFLVISGHKMYGPMGIGALFGKLDHLETMAPYQGGGDMILTVSFEKGTTFAAPPSRFEAGTPHVAGAIGLGAAVDFLRELDPASIAAHETDLLRRGEALLTAIPGVRLIGTAPDKASILNFVVDGIHPHDLGTVLDQEGVAVRTGHHCAQPTMERFGLPATARASIGCYNTYQDLEALAAGLDKAIRMFR